MSDIGLDDLRALFDIAVGSMDFSSGFLDRDEVDVLRRVAVMIGVDPIEATPSNWRTQYPHAYKPERRGILSRPYHVDSNRKIIIVCGHCEVLPERHRIHETSA